MAAATEELIRKGAKSSNDRSKNDAAIRRIIRDIKELLNRIEDAVPLMSLAITTSGAKLSTSLPSTVSPSRLLQASTFLSAGDTRYSILPSQAVQIGPTFTLSIYMLFASHIRPQDEEEGIRDTTWKEVMHKARLKLRRVPMDLSVSPSTKERRIPAEARVDEFAYQLLIIEDLDDGRVHTFDNDEPQPESYEGVKRAGIREILPVHQISKIFYADTGKLLNINPEGESNNPVLLLKRDINALPPRRMTEREESDYHGFDPEPEEEELDEVQAQLNAQLNAGSTPEPEPSYHEDSIPKAWRLPQDLDPEWIALEVYNEDEEASDSESEEETEAPSSPSRTTPIDPEMLAKLSLNDSASSPSSPSQAQPQQITHYNTSNTLANPVFINIRTSLSLLETLLRLTSLQQFQQQSHLSISDELLNFFLEESSTTGAGGDEQHRQRVRAAARGKVGFDPFDESPIKRRGEDYLYTRTPGSTPGRDLYSPANFPGVRSRENTPESPVPVRQSPSVRSGVGRRSVVAASPLTKSVPVSDTRSELEREKE